MNVPFRKSDLAMATAMAAGLAMGLGGCNTEADVIEEAPIDESTVVDATAPGVGAGNPNGDAEPATAIPGENALGDTNMTEPPAPSGAEPTNDIDPDRP